MAGSDILIGPLTGVSGGGGGSGWTEVATTAISTGSGVTTMTLLSSLPATVNEVEVFLYDVQVQTGVASQKPVGLRLGDSGGIETTGYESKLVRHGTSSNTYSTWADMITVINPLGDDETPGMIKGEGYIKLMHMGGNRFIGFSQAGDPETDQVEVLVTGVHTKTLSSTLTSVQLFTKGDEFTGGSVYVRYR